MRIHPRLGGFTFKILTWRLSQVYDLAGPFWRPQLDSLRHLSAVGACRGLARGHGLGQDGSAHSVCPPPAGRHPCGRSTCPRKKVGAQKHAVQLREHGLCPLGQDQSRGHGQHWRGGVLAGVDTERQGHIILFNPHTPFYPRL